MKKRAFRYSAYSLLLLSVLFFGARSFLYYSLEEQAITTRPNGETTPESFGVTSRQFQFESGERTIHASLVEANRNAPAVLIYHGRRETLSRWAETQAMLYNQGITSMVFDYSGFGSSTGEPTIENLHDDGVTAWQYFNKHVASDSQPKIVFGHSLGTGILMSGVNELNPKPDLVILSAPWTTARDAVIHLGMVPEEIYYILPDVWNNIEGAQKITVPLMVVHGTEDRIVPFEMGRQVAEAGNGRFVALDGTGHREMARQPTPDLWKPIIDAILELEAGG